ncbi:MAG: hypothetical protein EAZ57_02835 [Cytophagales bacterium]|nr:MAG: hypothetical protein EAZ67_03300 [Cytophagales bacterium]TAF61696.1 MAG: hypothetical protein EAZ57_02835 [Cytophagales bacterium]
MKTVSMWCIILLVFGLIGMQPKHPIHIATTEIVYNPDFNNLEITHKVFLDDLEKMLTKNFKGIYNVGQPKEHPDTDANIKQYFAQKFDLKVNTASARCDYMGKEVQNDAVYLYFEVENVLKVNQIFLKNTIFFDLFSDQSNLNHLKVGNSKRTVKCVAQKSEYDINF